MPFGAPRSWLSGAITMRSMKSRMLLANRRRAWAFCRPGSAIVAFVGQEGPPKIPRLDGSSIAA